MPRLSKQAKIFIILLIAAAAVYTGLHAALFVFSCDELYSVHYAREPIWPFIVHYFQAPDTHPIGYYLLLNAWQKMWQINFSNDWLYLVPSVIFYFLAVAFCAKQYLTVWIDRWWFLILAIGSSYFFVFAPMIRYYSLTALATVVAVYYLWQWLKTERRRDLIYGLAAMVMLCWSDYVPGLFLFILMAALFLAWPAARRKILNQDLWLGLLLSVLAILPSLYLYHVYTAHGTGFVFNTLTQAAVNWRGVAKFLLGVFLAPYHLLIGEYAQLLVSPLFYLLLIGLFYLAFRQYRKLPRGEAKQDDKFYSLFASAYIVLASFLLTFVFGRYSISLYARFMPAAGLILLVLLVRLCRPRWALIVLLAINLFVLVNNLQGKNFINATYFQPIKQTLAIARAYDVPILTPTNALSGINDDAVEYGSDYLLEKNFPTRTYTDIKAIKSDQYLLIVEYYMDWADEQAVEKNMTSQYNSTIISGGAYETINSATRSLLNKIGVLVPASKFHWYILQKNK